jgi:hypothetical protein
MVILKGTLSMTTYSVLMINFGIFKGTFDTLDAAVVHAKNLGFECAIYMNAPGKDSEMVRTVKPY